MGVAVLAVILVIGFLFTNNHPPSRYRQKRATGWNSYFHIAQWGFGFVAIGAGFTLALMFILDVSAWCVDLLFMLFNSAYRTPSWGTELFTYCLPGNLGVGTVSSFILAAAGAYGYAITKRQDLDGDESALMEEYEAIAKADGLERLLFESMAKGLLILVTLKSRKVYIGQVHEPRLIHGDVENIVIIPMLSGYRDKDTLKFTISHNYRDYYDKNAITQCDGYLRLTHFRTVIPASEIDSASLFDIRTYQQFVETENQVATAEHDTTGDVAKA